MNNDKRSTRDLIFLKAITPIHAGAGEGTGAVDLPIQREASTSFPKIESTGIKGCLLRKYNKDSKDSKTNKANLIFGKSDRAGAVVFTDMRILFFPVVSGTNIFSLVTCPYVLKRLALDSEYFMKSASDLNSLAVTMDNFLTNKPDAAYGTKESPNELYIGGYKFNKTAFPEGFMDSMLTYVELISDQLHRIVVVRDDVFSDFVNMNTEIITRNKIDDETGTTKDKALFTEEFLPSESILYGGVCEFEDIAENNDSAKTESLLNELKTTLCGNDNNTFYTTIGGGVTIGKGRVALEFYEEAKS